MLSAKSHWAEGRQQTPLFGCIIKIEPILFGQVIILPEGGEEWKLGKKFKKDKGVADLENFMENESPYQIEGFLLESLPQNPSNKGEPC